MEQTSARGYTQEKDAARYRYGLRLKIRGTGLQEMGHSRVLGTVSERNVHVLLYVLRCDMETETRNKRDMNLIDVHAVPSSEY